MEYNDTWQDTTLDQGLKWDHRPYPDELEQSKWGEKPLMKILDEQEHTEMNETLNRFGIYMESREGKLFASIEESQAHKKL